MSALCTVHIIYISTKTMKLTMYNSHSQNTALWIYTVQPEVSCRAVPAENTIENLQLVPSVGYWYAVVRRGLLTNLTSKTLPTSFTCFKPSLTRINQLENRLLSAPLFKKGQ